MNKLDSSIIDFIRDAADSDRYAAYLRNTLLELAAINTAPTNDIAANAKNERAFFDLIEREIRDIIGQRATCEWQPIDPAIAQDPDYAPPGYAADAEGNTLPADQLYRDRGNLIVHVPGTDADTGPAAILNAHVDVVTPFFPPKSAGDRIFGRGVADNKAQVTVLLAQLKLLSELKEKFQYSPSRGFILQFSIDEETGGNGSLSLLKDQRFTGLPTIVLDSTDLVPYCAHRGAVYYRCRLSIGDHPHKTAVEMFPFVVTELEAEGKRLKAETDCPMFSAHHVQTNHGTLGPYGGHPGNVCDHLAINIVAKSNANPQRVAMKMTVFMEDALAEYCRTYGDKQRETDPVTGKPKVERHFDLQVLPATDTMNFRLEVWGKSGHMGAIAECDNAITKAAYLLGGLLRIAPNFPNIQATGTFPESNTDDRVVILEGGQGFTPSHKMPDVQQRMRDAAERAVQMYCKRYRVPFEPDMVQMSFDQLHTDAYADAPDTTPMLALKSAFDALNMPWPTPTAWQTSCDARLYHHHGHPTAIFGAGKLDTCHSSNENINIADVQKALAIVSLASLAMLS